MKLVMDKVLFYFFSFFGKDYVDYQFWYGRLFGGGLYFINLSFDIEWCFGFVGVYLNDMQGMFISGYIGVKNRIIIVFIVCIEVCNIFLFSCSCKLFEEGFLE